MLNFHQEEIFFRNSLADSNAIVINSALAKYLGWEDPLGRMIYMPGSEDIEDYPLKIVGVVEDFNYASLHEDVKPLIILNQADRIRYTCIKINTADKQEILSLIEEKWTKFYPDYPFEYFFQNAKIQDLYTADLRMGNYLCISLSSPYLLLY